VTYAAEIAGINGHRLRNTTGGLATNRSIFFERTIPLVATTRENGLIVKIQPKEKRLPRLARALGLTKISKPKKGVIKCFDIQYRPDFDRGNEN